jgi:hypothetical protein
MSKDRIKLKRLEPSLRKIIKWRKEVQKKLEKEIDLSPAEVLNTRKWHDGLKAAKTAIYCLELIYRRRLLDQTAFAEQSNKVQKTKHMIKSRGTNLMINNRDNEELNSIPPIIPVTSSISTSNKPKVMRKRIVKPKLLKNN